MGKLSRVLSSLLVLLLLLSCFLVSCDQKGDEQIEIGDDVGATDSWADKIAYLNELTDEEYKKEAMYFTQENAFRYTRNDFDIRLAKYKVGSKKWRTECVNILKEEYAGLVLNADWSFDDPTEFIFQVTYDCYDQINGIICEYRPDNKCVGYFQLLSIGTSSLIHDTNEGHPAFGCVKKLPCYKKYDERLYYFGGESYYLRNEDDIFTSLDDQENLTRNQVTRKYNEYLQENFLYYDLYSQFPFYTEISNDKIVEVDLKEIDVNAEYVRNEIAIQCSQYKVGSAEWKACWEQPLLAKIDELAEDPQYAWLKTEGSEISELKFLHDCFGQISGVICEIRLDGECLGYLQLLNSGDQYFVDAVVHDGHPSCGCLKDLPIWWNDENRLYYFGEDKYYTPGGSGNYYLIPQPEFVFGETRYTGSTNREASIKNYYFYMKNTHGVNIFVEESSNETP